MEWETLTVDQRWHYRNVEWNSERTRRRRRELRQWIRDQKQNEACRDCGVDNPAVLDFHHRDSTEKTMAIVDMVTYGYGKNRLSEELEKCITMCANCHRKIHATNRENAETRRGWLHRYKRKRGCSRCNETDPRSLVFHHTGEDKQMAVSQMVTDGHPRAEIAEEIKKCEVLCANCHRQEHYRPLHSE